MLEITARVEKGRFPEKTSRRIREYLSAKDGEIYIHIERVRKQKSSKQRGYYWACMLPKIFNFSQGTEWEFENIRSIHEAMKREFLTIVPTRPDGTLMAEKVLSTEILNAKEVEEYYEQIRRLWIMRGCYIPLPNEFESESLELV